jgi:DNA polymerase I-like protein with 3'-5' exonuclease and polymerase domains
MPLRLYLDIETTTAPVPHDSGLLLVGWVVDDGEHVHVDDAVCSDLTELLADPKVTVVEQTKYDARWLMLAGHEVNGLIEDTTVMAWVLNENTPLDLDWMAWRYAGIEMDKRLRRSAGHVYFRDDDGVEWDLDDTSWHHLDTPTWRQFRAYNMRDVRELRTLHGALLERLTESEWEEYWCTEQVPYTDVLARMETRGLPVDIRATEALAE